MRQSRCGRGDLGDIARVCVCCPGCAGRWGMMISVFSDEVEQRVYKEAQMFGKTFLVVFDRRIGHADWATCIYWSL